MKIRSTRAECPITSDQLYGLLTHNRRQATEISNWAAIKDFFRQLFSLLPCVDFQSEAERLDALFNQVWQHKAPRDDLTCALKGIRNFLRLIDKLEAEHFSFTITHIPGDNNTALNIRYHNPAKSQEDCSTDIAFSADDAVHIIDFMQTHMTYSDTTKAYRIDSDKLDSEKTNIIFTKEVTEQYVFLVSLRHGMNDHEKILVWLEKETTAINELKKVWLEKETTAINELEKVWLEKERTAINELEKCRERQRDIERALQQSPPSSSAIFDKLMISFNRAQQALDNLSLKLNLMGS